MDALLFPPNLFFFFYIISILLFPGTLLSGFLLKSALSCTQPTGFGWAGMGMRLRLVQSTGCHSPHHGAWGSSCFGLATFLILLLAIFSFPHCVSSPTSEPLCLQPSSPERFPPTPPSEPAVSPCTSFWSLLKCQMSIRRTLFLFILTKSTSG